MEIKCVKMNDGEVAVVEVSDPVALVNGLEATDENADGGVTTIKHVGKQEITFLGLLPLVKDVAWWKRHGNEVVSRLCEHENGDDSDCRVSAARVKEIVDRHGVIGEDKPGGAYSMGVVPVEMR